jgi:hypothetical protein
MRIALIAALALAGACATEKVVVGKVSSTHTLKAPIGTLVVTSSVGSVAVEPATGPDVVVEAEVLASEDLAADLEDKQLAFTDHLRLTDDGAGRLEINDAHDGAADRRDWELRVVVRVPGAPEVRADVDVGTVRVRLPAASAVAVDVDTGNADVEVGRIEGLARVNVATGQARLAAGEALGGADVDVDTGNVALRLPANASGRLQLDTDVGSIEVASKYALSVVREVTSASASGAVGDGAGPARYTAKVDIGQIVVD